jgi:hypothetical protein
MAISCVNMCQMKVLQTESMIGREEEWKFEVNHVSECRVGCGNWTTTLTRPLVVYKRRQHGIEHGSNLL